MGDFEKAVAEAEARGGPEWRVLSQLDRTGDCWVWTGYLEKTGRARTMWRGRRRRHHRVVWEILIGPIPEGGLICHHCDNPPCANPNHLYVGDHQSNMNDKVSRRRHGSHVHAEAARAWGVALGKSNTWCAGERNPKAKLTIADVQFIRTCGWRTKALMERFGVAETTIQRARNGRNWSGPNMRSA